MRDCDPVGSIKEHTSPSGIFHNAAACTCCALEARAAACFGRWCRAQTHTAGLSPPLCVCSISARAAFLHASVRPFWEPKVSNLFRIYVGFLAFSDLSFPLLLLPGVLQTFLY